MILREFPAFDTKMLKIRKVSLADDVMIFRFCCFYLFPFGCQSTLYLCWLVSVVDFPDFRMADSGHCLKFNSDWSSLFYRMPHIELIGFQFWNPWASSAGRIFCWSPSVMVGHYQPYHLLGLSINEIYAIRALRAKKKSNETVEFKAWCRV